MQWDVLTGGEPPRLQLDWIERGGPRVEQPQRKGFGSTLLQRVLTTQCNARISFEFEPAGLRFSMVAPLVRDRLVPKY